MAIDAQNRYDFGVLAKDSAWTLGRRRRIWVGLTGSLAGGKTTTLKVFRKCGWRVFSSDKIVSEIYESFGLTKEDILKKFGRTSSGIRRLERWIHPKVKAEVLRRLRASNKPAIVEVPLLYESKFDRLFDVNIFVFAPRADRRKRALKRGMSGRLFDLLDSRQLSPSEKARRSDFVLHNHSKPNLKAQARVLAKLLRQ